MVECMRGSGGVARLKEFAMTLSPFPVSLSRDVEDKEAPLPLFFFSFFGVTVATLLVVDVVPMLSTTDRGMSTELRARGRPDEE